MYICTSAWKISGRVSVKQLTVFSLEVRKENFTWSCFQYSLIFSSEHVLILIIKTRKLNLHPHLPWTKPLRPLPRNQELNALISAQCSVFVYGERCLSTWCWGRYINDVHTWCLGRQKPLTYAFNVDFYPKYLPLSRDVSNWFLKHLLIHFWF